MIENIRVYGADLTWVLIYETERAYRSASLEGLDPIALAVEYLAACGYLVSPDQIRRIER